MKVRIEVFNFVVTVLLRDDRFNAVLRIEALIFYPDGMRNSITENAFLATINNVRSMWLLHFIRLTVLNICKRGEGQNVEN